MHKHDLIKTLAERTGLQQKQIEQVLVAQAALFSEQLIGEGDLVLPGIGKFKRVARAERQGRNPQTGERIVIAAHQSIVFKATQDMRSAVNAAA